MNDIWVSEAIYEEIKDRQDITVTDGPFDFEFDADGFMKDMASRKTTA
jgi:hypothetical protein